MTPLDPIIFRELIVIHKIIDDETWLEGERRGCWVSFDDPVVRENVCSIVLRIGQQMRENATKSVQASAQAPRSAPSQPQPAPRQSQAA